MSLRDWSFLGSGDFDPSEVAVDGAVDEVNHKEQNIEDEGNQALTLVLANLLYGWSRESEEEGLTCLTR